MVNLFLRLSSNFVNLVAQKATSPKMGYNFAGSFFVPSYIVWLHYMKTGDVADFFGDNIHTHTTYKQTKKHISAA